jgi:geranylgeranyl diphosphate synthase type I
MPWNLVTYARETLKSFVKVIDKKLVQIRTEHKTYSIYHGLFPKSSKINIVAEELLEHISEHNSRPAKRLRASLIYFAYILIRWDNLTKEIKESLLIASASIELVHTGLLIHDDFQDQDSIRRWMPTTHKHYEHYHQTHLDIEDSKEHFGASMAINAGDYSLTIGYRLLLKAWFDPVVTLQAMDYMLLWVSQTVYGQTFDIILENTINTTEQDIYDLHHAKTGIYTYLTPLLVWVALAQGSDDIKYKLMEYAIPCGIAFQLQDDVIGLFGDEEKTGKSAYSDIKEGKKTLLMLKAMELCSEHEREILRELWWNADLTLDQAEFVRSVVRSCGALEYSYMKAAEFAKKAQIVIQDLRTHDKELSTDVLNYLEGIAEYMASRREV